MALTREFRATVAARVRREPEFAHALLEQAVQALVSGDLDAGKSLMRDLVNATLGFEDLGARLHTSPKSLMRMLSAAGNPQARNLLAVLEALQDVAGVRLRVVSAAAARPARAAAPRSRR